MPKVPVKVDSRLLKKSIETAESDGPMPTQSGLWKRVAEIYNGQTEGKKISHSVVMLRVKEWGIPVKTKPGKRGRSSMAAARSAKSGQRQSKAEKFQNDEGIRRSLDILSERVPERFLPVLERVREGSRTAAVKLKCLECSVWQTPEIRNCTNHACALWAFRPYQGSSKITDEQEQEQDELVSV